MSEPYAGFGNEDDYLEDVFEESDYMAAMGIGFERCWFPTDFEVSGERGSEGRIKGRAGTTEQPPPAPPAPLKDVA